MADPQKNQTIAAALDELCDVIDMEYVPANLVQVLKQAADALRVGQQIDKPAHYDGARCMEQIEAMHLAPGFCFGNAWKYIYRADNKGNLVGDIGKAAWYVNRLVDGIRWDEHHLIAPQVPLLISAYNELQAKCVRRCPSDVGRQLGVLAVAIEVLREKVVENDQSKHSSR